MENQPSFNFMQASTTSANPTTSSSSSSGSGLTGWAAFGAKTSPSLPTSSKLGSSGASGSSKTMTTSSGQKPVGLSGLAGNKSGLGSAKVPGGNNGNSSSQVPLKPPPPLTLGKQPLNRSSSGENQGKGSASSGGSSPGGSQSSSGGNGGNGSNGNGSKVAPGDKTPTSQESQLIAMKRLQQVKKKAAQKKLKKWIAVETKRRRTSEILEKKCSNCVRLVPEQYVYVVVYGVTPSGQMLDLHFV